MMVFREYVEELRTIMDAQTSAGHIRHLTEDHSRTWPAGKKGNLVLSQDTAVELGHPHYESASFILCTDDPDQVCDGRISLVGPDVHEAGPKKRPFGKVVIIGMNDWNEDKLYERYCELDMVRYEAALQGYMLRATSQNQREWSRVSIEAILRGFRLQTLGSALAGRYRAKDYVAAVETIFVTSSPADVKALQPLGARVSRVMAAMNKMLAEMSFDCATCEYFDVCEEVLELRALRDAQQEQCA